MTATTAGFSDAIHRSMADESFLMGLKADPESVLGDYDLAADEYETLVDGTDEAVRDLLGSSSADVYVITLVWVK